MYWEEYDMPMATSHEAVKSVLTHGAFGREMPRAERAARPDHLAAFNSIDDYSLMRLEPPEHTRLRSVMEDALKGGAILAMAPTMSQLCDALIDSFPRGSAFDLQLAFADQLTGLTVMRYIGLPSQMYPQIRTWADQMSALQYARKNRAIEDTANAAAAAFTAFMESHLADRSSAASQDDFIGRILRINKTLTTSEVIALVLLFVQASTQGLAYMLGHALRLLVDYPDRSHALTPDQITATINECVRFEPPLHIIARHAQQDVTLLGQLFERDTQIGCLLGSACHDDAVWPDGNIFDPFRAARPHTGFGAGIHACVGASFSNMVMTIALPAFFSRCPKVRIAEEPLYANDFLFRRLQSLIVEV